MAGMPTMPAMSIIFMTLDLFFQYLFAGITYGAIYAVVANGKYERLTQDVINELEASNIGNRQGANQP